MQFEFATAGRILFGAGLLGEAGRLTGELGSRAFVVTGRDPDRAAPLLAQLDNAGLSHAIHCVLGEPRTDEVSEAAESARAMGADVVVGFGGGSALDAAKAVAALITNTEDVLAYLEVVGEGKPLDAAPAPCMAVPTTAGTGSEVTRNAVLFSPEHRVKVSMRHPSMLPDIALVDPLLTHSMPPGLTASTGLDALTQLLEAFVSNKANAMTDGLCREGLRRAGRSLQKAWADGSDGLAREDMALASLFGGLALANAKLGAVHGFAGPLGGMFPAPHGAVCARLLPFVMESNLAALHGRDPEAEALARYRAVAVLLTGDEGAQAEDGVAWVRALCTELQVQSLSAFGIAKADFPEVVAKSARASSMKGNPVVLTEEELTRVLASACGPA